MDETVEGFAKTPEMQEPKDDARLRRKSMIDTKDVASLIRSGKTTSEVARMTGLHRSTIVRLARQQGVVFEEIKIDWTLGDAMIKEGSSSDGQIAQAIKCSISSVRRRRTEVLSIKRGYERAMPLFNYKEALDKTFKQLHSKYFEWMEYQEWRRWCKTDTGQRWLLHALNVDDQETHQRPWEEGGSIDVGRSGHHGASL